MQSLILQNPATPEALILLSVILFNSPPSSSFHFMLRPWSSVRSPFLISSHQGQAQLLSLSLSPHPTSPFFFFSTFLPITSFALPLFLLAQSLSPTPSCAVGSSEWRSPGISGSVNQEENISTRGRVNKACYLATPHSPPPGNWRQRVVAIGRSRSLLAAPVM